MSMSSLNDVGESEMMNEHCEAADIKTRVFQHNFPTIFNYSTFEKECIFSQNQNTYLPLLSQEEKDNLLITKNREALELQMRLMDNHPVNITEDSVASDTLPHSNPPMSLSFID